MQNDQEARIIWEAFKKGDEDAFSSLFYRFSDDLFYYGCTLNNDREMIKDCIQELFCNLWERADRCPEVEKVKYFLLAALRRIILRKKNQNQHFKQDVSEKQLESTLHAISEPTSPEENIIEEETRLEIKEQIRSLVDALPPRQREAIHLRYYQGLSYAEMAEVMQVNKSSIGHFISGAIKSLRGKMTTTKFIIFLISFLFVGLRQG